jgi:hypothetical protein
MPRIRRLFADDAPDAFIPAAPEGRVRLERVRSTSLGGSVDLFTAVPQGHGDGAGLPVCLVLHGATARADDLQAFGLGRFLTAAVRRGAPPFVLAATDYGPDGWEGDAQRMLLEDMPRWMEERGFDGSHMAGWGWSLGGYGLLRLIEARPHLLRSAALFSPAVQPGDPSFRDAARLAQTPLGVWCGRDDALFPARDEAGRSPAAAAAHRLLRRRGAHPRLLEQRHAAGVRVRRRGAGLTGQAPVIAPTAYAAGRRCASDGSRSRTSRRRAPSRSAQMTPSPSGACASTVPQGSTITLWPYEGRRPPSG